MGGGQGGEEFGARQRVGGGVGEQAPPEDGAGAGDLGVPLRVQPPRPLGAGDDPGVHRVGPGGRGARAGGEGEHPRRRGPGRGRPGGGDEPPDVGALAQVVGGDVAEQKGVEDALADVVAQVAREDGVGDLHAGGGVGEFGSEDQPVAAVGEVVGQRERLLGQPRQPVAHFGGHGGEEREADGHVGDHRRRERGVEAVDDAHGGPGDDHRAPDDGEEQHPPGVVAPRSAEGGAQQDPCEAGDAGELRQLHVGAAAGDGGDGVEQVDEIGPAAEGEEFVHAGGAAATARRRCRRRRARRRARRAGRPTARRRVRSRRGGVSRPPRGRCRSAPARRGGVR